MRPFDHLRHELKSDEASPDGEIRSDPGRTQRTGGPEVIYGGGKSVEQILTGIRSLIVTNGRVIVSRITTEHQHSLVEQLDDGLSLHMATGGRAGLVTREGSARPVTGARVAVITAGTSDIPVAAEAALVAEETGCEVRTTWDVGVAGIHRLVRPLESMIDWDPDVFVAVAGMDGILPTIVTGLVAQPVIGLPTSTGYGFGGEGVGALTTMLQTCAAGLTVVNIDNGVGAGISAGRIANRAAVSRQQRV